LTRRANHRHGEIVAQIVKPAQETDAGFFNADLCHVNFFNQP